MNNIEIVKNICVDCGDASCVSLYFLIKGCLENDIEMSQIDMAKQLNTSLSTLKRWTKKLIDNQFIEVNTGERGGKNKYKILK